jgi:predicted lipoprotein with Yx(FWY)xxD motif
MSTTTNTFQNVPTIIVALGLVLAAVIGLFVCGMLLTMAPPALLATATPIMLSNDTETAPTVAAPGATVIVVTAIPGGPNVAREVTPTPTVTPQATATSAATITVQVGGSTALGPFLVDINGMTLYTFSQDTSTTSACTGECVAIWPPLIVAADTLLAGSEGIGGQLATITRDDGTLQVTYNGRPLYRYSQDVVPGDAKGQGIDNQWFVALP